MPNYFAQATLASSTGETADVNVNTFAFTRVSVLDEAGAIDYVAEVKAFYDAVRFAGGLKGLAQNGHNVKIYNAVTTTPNYPLFNITFGLTTAPGAIELPLEVSLCVSYANDTVTSVPTNRRRGRIYISGWGETDNTAGRPVATAYEGLVSAYSTYIENLSGLDGGIACVWSRTNGALYKIDRVWADNEWDTMRSRGGKATARDTTMIV